MSLPPFATCRTVNRLLTRKLLIPLALLILLAALALSLTRKPQAPQARFTTLGGQQIGLQQLRGKVVLVNFWATTCPGCIAEMPHLIETYRRYQPRGLEIVAVAMAYDPPAHVANYAEKNKLPFPVALDVDGKLALGFNDVKLTPTAFIIDQRGNIVRNVVGELDFDALHQYLEQQLGKAG
ncbi:MAG: TlpA family protein disulfide reductase [Methylobacterium sp.]|nr:TlpA family protein disulfide reductase [Methylobacterium sp.]